MIEAKTLGSLKDLVDALIREHGTDMPVYSFNDGLPAEGITFSLDTHPSVGPHLLVY